MFVFRQVFCRLIQFVKETCHKLSCYLKEKAKTEFVLKKTHLCSPVSNWRHLLLFFFLVTDSSFRHVTSLTLIFLLRKRCQNYCPAKTNKCKQIYSMLISVKAKTPNSLKKLVADLKLSNPQKIFSLPYRIASETYVWSFQYRMLNFIFLRMINYSK